MGDSAVGIVGVPWSRKRLRNLLLLVLVRVLMRSIHFFVGLLLTVFVYFR